MSKANAGYVAAYGDDPHTEAAYGLIKEMFDHPTCEAFFVFNGTSANALALAQFAQGYNSVVCQGSAHILVDECGFPELLTGGARMVTAEGKNGKISVDDVTHLVAGGRTDCHAHKPAVLSLTQ
eukprot:gene3509-3965_t